MVDKEIEKNEEAYFKSYRVHINAGRTAQQARALAIRESGVTPKDSWVSRLKKQVDVVLKGQRHAGTSQDTIDRLKGK